MNAFRTLLIASVTAVPAMAFPALTWAAAPAPHVRGTVSAIDGDSVTIHTDSGDVPVKLTDATRFAEISKASLDAIDKDTFIGTATKDVGSRLVALEVVVFPNAMRGTGEGHYDWDALPDTTIGGKTATASSMTNGTVSTVSAGGKVNSSMTNGTVATESAKGGAKELLVTYKGGEQHILVPPTAPIVKIAPGTRADLKVGSHVVVTEVKDSANAASVAVGMDGVTPPM